MKENVLLKNKNIIIMILLISSLFLPAFIQYIIDLGSYKQILIGSIVNTALFLSSFYVKDNKKIIALSVLPSISSMASGLLFSGLTFYSKLMIPFIWLGNLSIIYLTRILSKKMNYNISALISSVIKVSIIYGGFLLMSSIFDFPSKISTIMGVSMGITQVYTVCIGLVISSIMLGISKKL